VQTLNFHSVMDVVASNISGIKVHFCQPLPHDSLNKRVLSYWNILFDCLLLKVHIGRCWTCIVIQFNWCDSVTLRQVFLLLLIIYLFFSFTETLLFRIVNHILKTKTIFNGVFFNIRKVISVFVRILFFSDYISKFFIKNLLNFRKLSFAVLLYMFKLCY
jgi:hypothetical protein